MINRIKQALLMRRKVKESVKSIDAEMEQLREHVESSLVVVGRYDTDELVKAAMKLSEITPYSPDAAASVISDTLQRINSREDR